MARIDRILERLSSVKQSGAGFTALCPAHDDKARSLSVAEKDGKIIIHCFTGCTTDAVIKALGMEWSDLFPDSEYEKPASPPVSKPKTAPQRVATRCWSITDLDGQIIAKHHRIDFSDGTKKMWWEANGKTGLNGHKAEDLPLYGMSWVYENGHGPRPIIITEGEKAADALYQAGYLGLGTATGASNCPNPEQLMFLINLPNDGIYLWPDNDAPGYQHMERVAGTLAYLGITPMIIPPWPGAPKGADAADYLPNGNVDVLLSMASQWIPTDIIPEPQTESVEDPHYYSLTDTGNAERFITDHGEIIRYCSARNRWLIWSGKHWDWDDNTHILALSKLSARNIYKEVADETDDGRRKQLLDHARRSEAKDRRTAMVMLAQSEPGIPKRLHGLDRDIYLLNVHNGTIDLRTGDLKPHDKDDYITKILPWVYDPMAECPTWDSFIRTATSDDEDLQNYLQRSIGYTLTGDTRHQCLFFLYGLGSNGKSTFLNIIRDLLGDYATKASIDLFMSKDRRGGPNEGLANLAGKRMVIGSEIEDGRRMAVSLVKDITGGEPIRADRKHEHEFEYQPEFKLWLFGNHKPIITDTTYSIWRRVKLIHFHVTISEPDPDLPLKLKNEMSGILAWAVRGCTKWYQNGHLPEPNSVISATDQYRSESDILVEFIEDRCILQPTAQAKKKLLWGEYESWCDDTGIKPISQRAFRSRLIERGIEESKSGSARYWRGVGLLDPDKRGTNGTN